MVAEESKPRVLIIDSDPDCVQAIDGALAGEMSVSSVSTGKDAISVVHSSHPDLILLAVDLGDMDGYEVCKRLKTNPKTKPIPIIFINPRGHGENVSSGLNLGAIDQINHPMAPESVRKMVVTYLKQLSPKQSSPKQPSKGGLAAGSSPGASEMAPPSPRPSLDEGPGNRRSKEGSGRRVSDKPDRQRRTTDALAGDRRGGETARIGMDVADMPPPNSPSPPAGRRGLFAAMALAAIILAGGVYWLGDDPEDIASQAASFETASGTVGNNEPNNNWPNSDELEATVSTVDQPTLDWVSQSKCDPIPDVSWWGNQSHAKIVLYVLKKHSGDWKPYVDKWNRQLNKLQDIRSRGTAAVTPGGIRLKGDELEDYVGKVSKRVEIVLCLAGEAAEYASLAP